jgi:hypothetical protein
MGCANHRTSGKMARRPDGNDASGWVGPPSERGGGYLSRQCPAASAPGRIRTCDTRFRKPMLYPLSYEG